MLLKLKRKDQVFISSLYFINKSSFKKSEAFELMHTEEIKCLEKLRFDKRIWSFLLGRISSKFALKELVNVSDISAIHIKNGVFGFPVLCNPYAPNLQTSISHTDTIAGAVVFPEEHPLSIDIEKIEPNKLKSINSVLTTDEVVLLKQYNLYNNNGITMLWSAKESLSKLLKTGMMIDFKYLEIDTISSKEDTIIVYFKNFGQYKAICYSNSIYAIAIALPKYTTIHSNSIWNTFNTFLKEN